MGAYLATGIVYDISIQKRKKNDKILKILNFIINKNLNIYKIL